MTPSEALHTALRCYCRDKFKTHGGFLELILYEIERIIPDQVLSLDDMRNRLRAAVAIGREEFLAKRSNPQLVPPLEEICADLEQRITQMDPAELETIVPVPFLRVLTEEELATKWAQVESRWNLQGSFFQLAPDAGGSLCLEYAEGFVQQELLTPLREILHALGHSRIFELQWTFGLEIGPESLYASAEIGACGDQHLYRFMDACWIPNDLSWIIYASHEDRIIFRGKALVDAIEERLPGCRAQQKTWE